MNSERPTVPAPAALDFAHFRPDPAKAADVAPILGPIRVRFHLPALAAAVVCSNRLVGLGAVGVRKWGAPERVTVRDEWHVGSLTKSMTATLAAILVHQGLIHWHTRIIQVFPEYAALMQPEWKQVTLADLLYQRSGAPAKLRAGGLWGRLWRLANHGGAPVDQRLMLLTNVLAAAPAAPPGTKFIYSNAGYTIAGAMLERVAGQPWESLIRARLFKPLGMDSAGFGAPGTPGHIDEPWGHTFKGQTPQPVEPGPHADNPPAIAPAGRVHCTLLDMARYIAFHLAGVRGAAPLLPQSFFKKLHTPAPGQDYAMGWVALSRSWAHGVALNHTGSNTMWYANLWLAPNRDFGLIVFTNIGGNTAFRATDQAAAKLIARFLERK